MARKKKAAQEDDLMGDMEMPTPAKPPPRGKREKTKQDEALEMMLDGLNKKFGKGTVMVLGDAPIEPVESISTGSILLNNALGPHVGGFARGRIIEIYGPESCLAGDTFIQYNVRTEDGRRMNHKGGTIRRLWERFHGKSASGDGRGKYLRPVSVGAKFTAPCLNEEDRVFHNEIVDVVMTGVQECFELSTIGGHAITATAEHKFFTGREWKALGELEPGDVVMIHNSTPFRVLEPSPRMNERAYLYVKHHPVAGEKVVNAAISREDVSLRKDYLYRRLARSRAVVEADMNGLSLEEYRQRLDNDELEGLEFLGRDDHVHHIDENVMNDDLSNLLVMRASEHGRLHALERHNNLRFVAVEDIVSSIVPVGVRETFDLKMLSPFNNYVADHFVVHNSGKTTLTLHAIAETHKAGGRAAFVDAEHALDLEYARNLGVDTESLVLSQPDYGEQALEVAETLVRSCLFDLVVIDSVSALVPKSEVDGEMGDSHVGLQARLMSQACRKLAPVAHQTSTTVIFINQLRMKIGVMFGNPETTSGGNALKFYASVRLDIRRIGSIKKGDQNLGNQTRVKVIKNKLAPPFRQVEFDILFGKGINRAGEVVDLGVKYGVIEKAGSYYSWAGSRIGQGRQAVVDWLNNNPEQFEEIEAEVVDRLTEEI